MIVIALGLLIIYNINSHQDKEIQENINKRNELKLLILQSDKEREEKKSIAFKNAIAISNLIANRNENYKITSLNTTKILIDSYEIPEISVRLIWNLSDCKLKISMFIEKNERDGFRVSESMDFYDKSENEILENLKVVFEKIQNEYSLTRIIYL